MTFLRVSGKGLGAIMACPSDSAIQQFVADQLPPALEQQLVEHLEACEECRQRAETISGGESLRSARSAEATCAAYDLAATCDEPEELREDLYQLGTIDAAVDFPASEQAAEILRLLGAAPTDEVAGAHFGRFTIRRWLGAGGFGVVFLAYDELLHREVALKLPLAQSLSRREVRERFLREAEAAAQLHHPNVVPVYEAGEEQGICYIASGYCRGPTLDAWLSEQSEPAAVATAVTLVRQLAEAVQHAHHHRVLHRDIKPSNVLLEPNLADPVALTPMITDFGLAKLLDSGGGMTGSQGMLGTPRYMAPEQAAGNRAAIGPATDVFGLGAILYELLTGVAPYAGEDQAQTLHRLFHERVVPPRRLRSEVPRDLEAICLKCLERRPADRYATAQELADDLRRFEEGRTTRARPISRLEKLRRWTIRQPAMAALLLVSSVGLLLLLAVFVVHNRSLEFLNAEVQSTLREAEAHDRRVQNLLYISKIQLAHQAVEENDLRQAARLLQDLRGEAPEVTRGFVWRYLWNRVAGERREIEGFDRAVYDLQFAPGGDRFAAGGADGTVQIHDGRSFAPLVSIATDQGEVNTVAFSPDSRLLATAGDDGTVRLWDAQTGELQRVIEAHDGLAFGAVFTADGATLITCGQEPVIRLWDVATGASRGVLEGHTETVESIVLAPDGVHLASASSDETARIWDLEARKSLRVLRGHTSRVVDAKYSPGGDYLLTGSIDRTLRLWRAADGECLQIEDHVDGILSVAFLDGDQQLMAADRGGSVYVWQRTDAGTDVRAAAPMHSWRAHEGRVWEAVLTPDDRGVITAGADGKIFHWEQPATAQELIEIADAAHGVQDVAFDPRADRLHFIRSGRGVETCDFSRAMAITQLTLDDLSQPPVALAPTPDEVLVLSFGNATVEAVELPSQQLRFRLATPWGREASDASHNLEVSRNGRRLAIRSYLHDTTLVYDIASRTLLGKFKTNDAQAMALSDDGSQIAMSDGDDVLVWNVDSGKRPMRLKGHTSSVGAVSFSRDGRWLATGSKDRHVRIWDLAKKTPHASLEGHRAAVGAVAFSPGGRLLASGDERGELKIWFLAESAELIAIKDSAPIRRLVFSPDGNRLAQQSPLQIRIFNATRTRFRGSSSDSL